VGASSTCGVWTTDGTEPGTRLLGTLADAGVQDPGCAFFAGAVVNGRAYFQIRASAEAAGGWESILRTDGTPAGTTVVTQAHMQSWYLLELWTVGELAFFEARSRTTADNDDSELWRTDGTASGTFILSPLARYHGVKATTSAGALFVRPGPTGSLEPWFSDGSLQGTRLVRALALDPPGVLPPFVVFRDHIYFPAGDGVHGSELWVTDGSASGTRMVADLVEGSWGSIPSGLAATKDALYLFASFSPYGRRFGLWKYAPPAQSP
jgi:ELWxxDGT repeat protein